MSKADKMFEKLGYKKILDDDICELFVYKNMEICFCKIYKSVEGSEIRDGMEAAKDFYMKELKAINEKVKELGWIDE